MVVLRCVAGAVAWRGAMNIQTYNAAVRAGLPVGPASIDPLMAMEGIIAYGGRLAFVPSDAMAFLRHARGLLHGAEGGGGGIARTWSETALFAECAVREAHKELQKTVATMGAGGDEAARGGRGDNAPSALGRFSWWRAATAARDDREELARLARDRGREKKRASTPLQREWSLDAVV